MNLSVPIALFGWPMVAPLAFLALPARRAVLATMLGAWLFLPKSGFALPGFVDYTRTVAACLGTGLGIAMFDSGRILAFRPALVDIPMGLWCLAPMASSLHNGLGPYDGMSGVAVQAFAWGIPYFFGRLYLADSAGLRDLALAVLIGGVIYMPLCLIEVRLSPQLNKWVYGFYPAPFITQKRFGGYRPMVFMDSGLATALWMASASLVAFWLWRSRCIRTLLGLPVGLLAAMLMITTLLCKSLGAIALLGIGLSALWMTARARTGALVLALAAVPAVYVGARTTGLWSGASLVSIASAIDESRAQSLKFRFDNEDILAAHAMRRPLLGWGGWSRNRVLDDRGRDISVTDGLWIIAMGKTGLLSVAALLAMLSFPVLALLRCIPTRRWHEPAAAAPAVLAMVVLLYAMDSLLNAMLNPVYTLAVGGLSGFARSFSSAQHDPSSLRGVRDGNSPVAGQSEGARGMPESWRTRNQRGGSA